MSLPLFSLAAGPLLSAEERRFIMLVPRLNRTSSEGSLDVAKARSFFPALSSQASYIYANNAGGSQCSKPVIDRIADYLSTSNVQSGIGADHSVAKASSDKTDLFNETARILFNARSADEIVLGSTTTLLFENLARAMERDLEEKDEIIATGEHAGMHRLLPWQSTFWRVGEQISQRMSIRGGTS